MGFHINEYDYLLFLPRIAGRPFLDVKIEDIMDLRALGYTWDNVKGHPRIWRLLENISK